MVRFGVRKRDQARPACSSKAPVPGWLEGSSFSPLLRRWSSLPVGSLKPAISARLPSSSWTKRYLPCSQRSVKPCVGVGDVDVAERVLLGGEEVGAAVVPDR